MNLIVLVCLQNISGTFASIISLVSLWMAPDPRTAAIYYFITALFALLVCFDTYFALPLNVSLIVHVVLNKNDMSGGWFLIFI